MDIKQIIADAKAITLNGGEAIFVTAAGEIIEGMDGNQPSNTCCLAVGPDDDRNWGEIEEALEEFAAETSR